MVTKTNDKNEGRGQAEANPGGKGGLLTTLALVAVAGGGAFALVSLVPQNAVPGCETTVAHPPIAPSAAKYIALDPLAVALKPDAGARTLRIGLALGLSDAHAELAEADILRLKDGFLDSLRKTDSAAITDPTAMPALREALLTEARLILGEGAVASLLITDFLMR